MSEYGMWFLGDNGDGTVYTGSNGDDMWSLDKRQALPLNAYQALEALEDVDSHRIFRHRILPLRWEELKNFEKGYF